MEVIVVTGLSGAGKSNAISGLEDLGYYCVDNMPLALISNFMELCYSSKGTIEKVAFVVDIRGLDFAKNTVEDLNNVFEGTWNHKVIFLEASDEVLLRRYSETRRKHPLSASSVDIEDIKQEREDLLEIREYADFVIDTSQMKPMDLKNELINILTNNEYEETFVINILSFGFKYGVPMNADFVFDMRFIPNPYYLPELKAKTGNDKVVREYVMKHIESKIFKKNTLKMINAIIPCFMKQGKYHINMSFGCTGGQHRSVTMANEMYDIFMLQGRNVTLEHRDVKK